MKFPESWLDQNGFVIPQPSTKPADNGVLFTAVAKILGFDFPNYKDQVRSCYLKKGLMARWPKNDFDQAAWDDYLAVAVASVIYGHKDLAKEIIFYGLTHGFFYDTDKKLQFKDFLLRNVPIWPMMISAAYPFLKYPLFPIIWLVQYFFNTPNLNDTSAIQLQWLYLIGAKHLGFEFKALSEHEKIIEDAFKIYYHKDHPFNNTEQYGQK